MSRVTEIRMLGLASDATTTEIRHRAPWVGGAGRAYSSGTCEVGVGASGRIATVISPLGAIDNDLAGVKAWMPNLERAPLPGLELHTKRRSPCWLALVEEPRIRWDCRNGHDNELLRAALGLRGGHRRRGRCVRGSGGRTCSSGWLGAGRNNGFDACHRRGFDLGPDRRRYFGFRLLGRGGWLVSWRFCYGLAPRMNQEPHATDNGCRSDEQRDARTARGALTFRFMCGCALRVNGSRASVLLGCRGLRRQRRRSGPLRQSGCSHRCRSLTASSLERRIPALFLFFGKHWWTRRWVQTCRRGIPIFVVS